MPLFTYVIKDYRGEDIPEDSPSPMSHSPFRSL